MDRRALLLASLSAALLGPPTAEARCARVELPDEVRRSAFVVEAEVERAGSVARFRTRAVWKGRGAPTTFTLGARRGRGRWPWADDDAVGERFLLFLQPLEGGRFTVSRCGSTGPPTEAMRRELRALGLSRRGGRAQPPSSR